MKVSFAILLAIVFSAVASAQDSKLITKDQKDFDRIVKGASFSAEAVLDGVQVLADGTRIIRRSTGKLYRDSEGRLRREESRTQLGIPGANVELPESIEILDPVSGYKYKINSKDRTVRQSGWDAARKEVEKQSEMRAEIVQKQTEKIKEQVEKQAERIKKQEQKKAEQLEKGVRAEIMAARQPGEGPSKQSSESAGAKSNASSNQNSSSNSDASANSNSNPNSKPKPPTDKKPKPDTNSKTESLGVRNIEGVQAEGTRTTTTIPAGTIGNDRDINVVYEKWYSKELRMTILSKHNDPRFGEQTYRLTNISRDNPPIALFQPPVGFKMIGQNGWQTKMDGSPPKPPSWQQSKPKPADPSEPRKPNNWR